MAGPFVALLVIAIGAGPASAGGSEQTAEVSAARQACLDGVMTFAHRGTGVGFSRIHGKLFVENTIPAIQAAAEAGACGVEYDLQMTRDGVVIVHHDDSPFRINGRVGRFRKHSATWALNQTSRRGGAHIATLDDMVRAAADLDVVQQQDIQQPLGIRALRRIVATDRALVTDPSLIFISARDVRTLCTLKRLAPEYETGLVVRGGGWASAARKVARRTVRVQGERIRCVDSLNVEAWSATTSHLRAARSAGLRVLARRVESPRLFNALKKRGADWVGTDDLRRVAKLR